MVAQYHRPVGMTVLAALASLACIVSALIALFFLGAIPAALVGGTGFFGQALLGAILWGILSLIWGSVAVGLWLLKPQSWLFVIAFTVLNLTLAVVSLLGGTSFEALLPSILFNAAILIYCLSPGAKESFRLPHSPT